MTADFRRIALSFAIAIVATILVAMSARAFFPNPERPRCERETLARVVSPDGTETAEQKAAREACDAELQAFEDTNKGVAKNQFFVLMVASVIMLGVGVALYSVPVISSGILWGGVVSLIYTLFFSFQPGIEDYYRLVAAVVSFIALIALAYKMFGKEIATTKK